MLNKENTFPNLHLKKRLAAKWMDLAIAQIFVFIIAFVSPNSEESQFSIILVYFLYLFSFSIWKVPTLGKFAFDLKVEGATESKMNRLSILSREIILWLAAPVIFFSLLFKPKVLLHDFWLKTEVVRK